MRDAHASARTGTLSIKALISRLNEIGVKSVKYETVELCFDLMATRGELGTAKARVVDLIAKSLELDIAEYEKIRDAKIVTAAPAIAPEAQIEGLLGIDPSWDRERIKRYLRSEFQKWNNRLGVLPEGVERDSAQRMLDAISEARKRYG
jgi:hypothetical protein